MASQNNTLAPDLALEELETLIKAAEEFHNPKCIFQDTMRPETKALVVQVSYLTTSLSTINKI